jgi:type 1 glutamine amidotransferase
VRRLLAAALSSLPALAAAGGEPVVAAGEAPRLLLVTVTKGYRHDSIPAMVALVERLGRESGAFTTERAETEADLLAKTTPRALGGYQGVVFVNTSDDVPLADRPAFLAWVEGGGALVGIHGAAATLQGWPAWVNLLGGEFDYHREQAKVSVRVEDPAHPATAGLASPFDLFDEIYIFKSFDRSRVRVLLSTDRHPNTGEPGLYPLAWVREPGQGRVFFTAPGHRDDVVSAPWFAKHLLGGIRWAIRR